MRYRSSLQLAASLTLCVGCTSLLGIDNDYLPLNAAGSGGAPGGDGGGVQQASGGTPTTGGAASTGGVSDSGGASPSAKDAGPCAGEGCPDGCELGDYQGSFSGHHAPSAGLLAVLPPPPGQSGQLPLVDVDVQGDVRFTLSTGDGGAARVSGTFASNAGSPITLNGFQATLEGTFDCATGAFDARLTDGQFGLKLLQIRFEGTAEGSYARSAQAVMIGKWSESEIPAIANAIGNGTFTATRVTP